MGDTKAIIKRQRRRCPNPNSPTQKRKKFEIAQTKAIKIMNIASKPIPHLIDYWKVNEFIDGMNKSLKCECNAIGISYIDPLVVDDNDMIDIEEDFKWTQQVSAQYNVPWTTDFDLNAFAKVVAQCNE